MKTRTSLSLAAAVACGLALLGATEAADPKKRESAAPVSLFNGDNLGKWKSIPFGNEGHIHVSFDGDLTLENGDPFTGVVWTGDPEKLPKSNYEISLQALKHYGDDFFCALTFPVKKSHATLICGGWGGVVVGVSSIDGKDASVNETTQDRIFERNRWYKIRVRVTDDRLTGWIDGKEVFDVELAGKSIALRPGAIEMRPPGNRELPDALRVSEDRTSTDTRPSSTKGIALIMAGAPPKRSTLAPARTPFLSSDRGHAAPPAGIMREVGKAEIPVISTSIPPYSLRSRDTDAFYRLPPECR